MTDIQAAAPLALTKVRMIYKDSELDLEVKLIKDPGTGELVPFEWRNVVGYEGYYQVSNLAVF